MKRRLIQLTTATVMAAGLVLAQNAAPAPQPGHGPGPGRQGARMNWQQRRAQRFQRMATYLNLTPQQREQAKAIMDEARQSAQPIAQQLKQGRQQLVEAVKTAKSGADIERLANQQGVLIGQLLAIRTKAMEKGYALLTPEQRQKADQLGGHMRQMFHNRFGAQG